MFSYDPALYLNATLDIEKSIEFINEAKIIVSKLIIEPNNDFTNEIDTICFDFDKIEDEILELQEEVIKTGEMLGILETTECGEIVLPGGDNSSNGNSSQTSSAGEMNLSMGIDGITEVDVESGGNPYQTGTIEITGNPITTSNVGTEALGAYDTLAGINFSSGEGNGSSNGTSNNPTATAMEMDDSYLDQENTQYADLGFSLTEEDLTGLLRAVYTEETIEELDIDDELKELLKLCMESGDMESFLLIVEIIQNQMELQEKNKKLEDLTDKISKLPDGSPDYSKKLEETEQIRAEIIGLRQKDIELRSELELMQFKPYYLRINEEGYQEPSLDILSSIPLDENGLPFIEIVQGANGEYVGVDKPNISLLEIVADNKSAVLEFIPIYGIDGYVAKVIENYKTVTGKEPDPLMTKMVEESLLSTLEGLGVNPETPLRNEVIDLAAKHFTEEEIKVYYMLLEEEGVDRANDYLQAMGIHLKKREGREKGINAYKEVVSGQTSVGRVISTFFQGTEYGLIGHFDNLHGFFTNDATVTINDYALQTFQEMMMTAYTMANTGEITIERLDELRQEVVLADGTTASLISQEEYIQLVMMQRERKEEGSYLSSIDVLHVTGQIDEEIYLALQEMMKDEKFKEFVSEEHPIEDNIATYALSGGISTGNMLPAIVLGCALNPLGVAYTTTSGTTVTFGQIAGNISMFAGSATGTWRTAIQEGLSSEAALLYGAISGLSEVTTGYFLGSVPFVSKTSKVMDAVSGNIGRRAFLQVGFSLLRDYGSEALEEVSQIFIGTGIEDFFMSSNTPFSEMVKQIPETLGSTAFSVAATNGVPAVVHVGAHTVNVTLEEALFICKSKNQKEVATILLWSKIAPKTALETMEMLGPSHFTEYERAYVVSRMPTDRERIKGLELINNEEYKTLIVESLLTDEAKLEGLGYIEKPENRARIIEGLSEESKFKVPERAITGEPMDMDIEVDSQQESLIVEDLKEQEENRMEFDSILFETDTQDTTTPEVVKVEQPSKPQDSVEVLGFEEEPTDIDSVFYDATESEVFDTEGIEGMDEVYGQTQPEVAVVHNPNNPTDNNIETLEEVGPIETLTETEDTPNAQPVENTTPQSKNGLWNLLMAKVSSIKDVVQAKKIASVFSQLKSGQISNDIINSLPQELRSQGILVYLDTISTNNLEIDNDIKEMLNKMYNNYHIINENDLNLIMTQIRNYNTLVYLLQNSNNDITFKLSELNEEIIKQNIIKFWNENQAGFGLEIAKAILQLKINDDIKYQLLYEIFDDYDSIKDLLNDNYTKDIFNMPPLILKAIENNWSDIYFLYSGKDIDIYINILKKYFQNQELSGNDIEFYANFLTYFCGSRNGNLKQSLVTINQYLVLKKYFPGANINILFQKTFNSDKFDLVFKIIGQGKFEQFSIFLENTKKYYDFSLETNNGLTALGNLANFFQNYPNIVMEIINNPKILENNYTKFIYLLKSEMKQENCDSFSDVILNFQKIKDILHNHVPGKLHQTKELIIQNLFNLNFKIFRKQHSTGARLLNSLNEFLTKNLTIEQRTKVENFKNFISIVVEVTNQFNFDKIKEVIDSIDENMSETLFNFGTLFYEHLREISEIDANLNLTKVNDLPSNLYNNEYGYYDLTNSEHTFYIHSTRSKNIYGLVNPSVGGLLHRCVSVTNDRMKPANFFTETSDAVLLVYDYIPQGGFIASSSGDVSSNGYMKHNDYGIEKLLPIHSSYSLIRDYDSSDYGETNVYYDGFVPSAIMIVGDVPSEVERQAAKELGELLGLDGPAPLIKTQKPGTKIENPQPIDYK